MNERIQELYKEAMVTVPENPGNKEFTWFDPEKFAELIIRECADIIDNKEMITVAQSYDEVFVAKYDTRELCAKEIKQHFGVK